MKGFEDVVNGIMRIPNIDVYVTGSNSRFLSTDKTIKSYIDYLEDAFLIEEAIQYDIKAKRDNDGVVTMGLLDFLTDRDSLNR